MQNLERRIYQPPTIIERQLLVAYGLEEPQGDDRKAIRALIQGAIHLGLSPFFVAGMIATASDELLRVFSLLTGGTGDPTILRQVGNKLRGKGGENNE